MSDTASSPAERLLFPAWVVFAGINTALMFALPGAETVPFHFVWISMAVVYGVRPWPLPVTYAVLAVVCLATGTALVLNVRREFIGWEETTEVPLMSAVFLAMVWHVRRRTAAVARADRHAAGERRMRDAQKRFVRFASHELRTPVTVARGYTELIRDGQASPQVEQDAAIVLDELDKLERIAGRLLTLAQIDEPATLRPRQIDLDVLLSRTIQRWRATACRTWSLDARAGSVTADPERLETALDSLLDNAVRYTAEGGQIRLVGCRDGGAAVIEVHDDGAGIAGDDLGFVFESFRSGAGGGTGMGLAIVRAIVEAHGGDVSVVSGAAAGGATFTLRIPIRPSAVRTGHHPALASLVVEDRPAAAT
jgi:two-component system, OmpR family, sensor kinase